jgi:phosphonate transport system ATP-binding protein
VTRLDGSGLRAHRAQVGMIYQQFNLVRRLRVLDNVLIGRLPHLTGWPRWASLAGWFGPAEREVALRCLDHVGLLSRVWQRADTLSGGEQQRVAIAKVLAQEPALVLADEPVASLDLANGTLVMETLRGIAAEARLPVVATLHHVDYARRYAHRVLGLRAGRLVLDARPDRLTDGMVRDVLADDDAAGPPEFPRAERLAS